MLYPGTLERVYAAAGRDWCGQIGSGGQVVEAGQVNARRRHLETEVVEREGAPTMAGTHEGRRIG